ncbi:MAG: phosphate ABC transporter ATP-binding protein [Candidatus Omnitrophota bacterium]|jgi:phosphate transport system ATP-binding protein|nr:MAG: phosphate ABC transporter ATP-binding protein [Candidatus Omnitrophota bacterium]
MVKFSIKDLNVWFGQVTALREVSLDIQENEILSIIGPSNSGKTTFLRMLNRLNELQPGFRMFGRVLLDNRNIMNIDAELLRRQVGMVFALPLPLPMSIFDNVAYGIKMQGGFSRQETMEIVESSLESAYIWDEVKDRLNESAFKLSGGQQQRLCIARTLAVRPKVILFDEPCSGLDPVSTAKVEEAMLELKKKYSIVLVTNNVKQAARVGDKTGFFLSGELIELDTTEKIFTGPSDKRTEEYIMGKFG